VFFLMILLSAFYASAQQCEVAFSAANYCVSNTNKAYEGNNSQQVREWTEKAMETFNEVEEITAECGCTQVSELAYQGFEACDKAQIENSYERARFFAKRAREKAKLMMIALSKCTNIPLSDIEARHDAGAELLPGGGQTVKEIDQNDLNAQQEDLLARQKDLLEQQRLLQQQIADQQKQVAALKQKRANELVQQKRIKVSAEIALTEIQRSYEKLATSIGCTEALKITRISFTKTVDALEKETLRDTKEYYTSKLNEIVDKFTNSFSECSADW